MSYKNVGLVWTTQSFDDYLSKIKTPPWCKAVCLHHCGEPNLQQRPKGLLQQHIINIKNFYERKGWNRGPHLFVDEDQIYGMTPLNEAGIHAVSFNAMSIGIEVLGDYDEEDPLSGRGLQCWQTAAAATKSLLQWLKLPMNEQTILFHRNDPKTSKTCPGTKVKKDWFINLMQKTQPAAAELDIEFAPVLQYVVSELGYDAAVAGKLINRKNKLFFFGDDWLEGAYYDVNKQCTMAPIKELKQIKLCN